MDLAGILGIDSEVRNGFKGITVKYKIDADAKQEDIEALVAQSQKRSAVYDIVTNPTSAPRDGTRCVCSLPIGRAGCRALAMTATIPMATERCRRSSTSSRPM